MTKLQTVLLRRWPILLVALILGVVAGGASALFGAERQIANYQAEQVLVANDVAGSPANVDQDALKVTRGAVPAAAAEKLGSPGDGVDLARKIDTRASTDSSSIKLTTFDVDPDVAAARVDAFGSEFLRIVNAELRRDETDQLAELRDRRQAAQNALDGFDQQNPLIQIGGLPASPEVDILVAERQRLAETLSIADEEYRDFELQVSRRLPYSSLGPSEPRLADAQLVEVPSSPLFRAGLVGAIGLMLGVGLVLIIERANVRIDTREDLAELAPFPIIAEVNRLRSRRQPRHHDGRLRLDGPWSEQYRRVKSAIQFAQTHEAPSTNGHGPTAPAVPRVFLFVSALPAEGKSTSVALTATALAQDGQPTLAINADFRVPRLDGLLGADASPSIADRAELSTQRATIDEVLQKTLEPNLTVASSGPPSREVTRRIQSAAEIATEIASRGETVLIDSTPLQVANDTIDLLPCVDQVILVVRAGRTTKRALEDAMASLEQHEASVLGAVLVDTLADRETRAYYGTYYSTAGGQRTAREDLVEAIGLDPDNDTSQPTPH